MAAKNKISLLLLVCALALNIDISSADVPKYGLEAFEYNELILLKVAESKKGAAACFFATHNYAAGGQYVWLYLHERVGKRSGEIVAFEKQGLRIAELQSLNGNDWVEMRFLWPIAKAKDAEKLAAGCGDKPNR